MPSIALSMRASLGSVASSSQAPFGGGSVSEVAPTAASLARTGAMAAPASRKQTKSSAMGRVVMGFLALGLGRRSTHV